jgi:hypothetical protein
MRTQKELSQFVVLRSNGWSLAKISKHLNIPKTALFRWEGKNAETIHLLKYVQLEKIQEQYVPSYEEQLKDTHEHLARIQAALKQQDYTKMSPEFLLQMNFQLQTRLDKIRQQVPLRTPQIGVPLQALPPIGCVTKDDNFPREGDFSDPDPNVEGEPPIEPAAEESREHVVPPAALPTSTDNGQLTTDRQRKNPIIHPSINPGLNGNGHTNGNGHAHTNGNGKPHPNGSRNGSIRTDPCLSVVENENPNGTFRNENPRGSKLDPSESTTSNNENGTTVPFRKDNL